MEKIATRNGMRLEMYWADTASRGGLSRGLRRSILKADAMFSWEYRVWR